jgi:hypothetical protein
MVLMGFPIDQVCDWTEEEARLVSSGMCPETPELYRKRQENQAEIQRYLEQYQSQRYLEQNQRIQEEWRQALRPEPTQPTWADLAEEAQQEAMRDQLELSASAAQEEDFPLEFEDENKCPACLEDEYTEETCLLRLPCGHTLCKGCLKGVDNKCPKCRKGIDRSLVKRKK